jgi:hypothetical protein
MSKRTYTSRRADATACWQSAAAESDGDSQSNSLLAPLLAMGKRRRDGSDTEDNEEDDSQDSQSLLAEQSTSQLWLRPSVASATDLAASGKSRTELDNLTYLMEGVNSPTKEVARASALRYMLKQSSSLATSMFAHAN